MLKNDYLFPCVFARRYPLCTYAFPLCSSVVRSPSGLASSTFPRTNTLPSPQKPERMGCQWVPSGCNMVSVSCGLMNSQYDWRKPEKVRRWHIVGKGD